MALHLAVLDLWFRPKIFNSNSYFQNRFATAFSLFSQNKMLPIQHLFVYKLLRVLHAMPNQIISDQFYGARNHQQGKFTRLKAYTRVRKVK